MSTDTMRFSVPGMTCGHCEAAVKGEIGKLDGITGVDVDLATKAVAVHGTNLDRNAIGAAVDEAGFEADFEADFEAAAGESHAESAG
jgi:copper chaperone CopZ